MTPREQNKRAARDQAKAAIFFLMIWALGAVLALGALVLLRELLS